MPAPPWAAVIFASNTADLSQAFSLGYFVTGLRPFGFLWIFELQA